MSHWKDRLYQSYVSSNQASGDFDAEQLNLKHLPHITQLIRRHVPDTPSCRIIDLGCGHGAMVAALRQLGYTDITGIDASSEQVALAEQLGIQGIQQGDILEFMTSYTLPCDVIFLMDVLEHLDRQTLMDMLDAVHSALNKQGKLIIHVPNAEGLYGMRIRYGDLTHETAFTPQSIQQLLLTCGFSDIQAYEDKPVIHGSKSLIRRCLWETLTLRDRLLLLAETGMRGHILSQNMLVTASR